MSRGSAPTCRRRRGGAELLAILRRLLGVLRRRRRADGAATAAEEAAALPARAPEPGEAPAPSDEVAAWPAEPPLFSSEALDGLFDGLDGGPFGEAVEGRPEEGFDQVPENRELFEGIAGVYVQPARQFLTLLRRGPVSREWLDVGRPAVAMVARSARSMGLPSLAAPLEELEGALGRAAQEEGPAVEGATREAVLAAFRGAAEALPAALGDGDCGSGDGAVLPSFLRQVPGVGRATVARIFAAGLTSFDALGSAGPAELAVTTGIGARKAERICTAVAAHRAESRQRLLESSPAHWPRLLEEAVGALEERHAALRAVDESAGRGAPRLRRRLRDASSLKVAVLLAEMGEGQLLDEVQRLSVPGRVRRVRQFLSPGGPTSQGT